MGNIHLFHGRLGRDAVSRETRAGVVVELSIACDFIDKNGQKTTHWFKASAWHRAGELGRLRKGDQVLVYAPPHTVEVWTGRDGEERQTLVLNAVKVEVLKSGAPPTPADAPRNQPTARPSAPAGRSSDDW